LAECHSAQYLSTLGHSRVILRVIFTKYHTAKCHFSETHSARNATLVNATFLKDAAPNYVIILASNLRQQEKGMRLMASLIKRYNVDRKSFIRLASNFIYFSCCRRLETRIITQLGATNLGKAAFTQLAFLAE
jgi:hypothetical protein